MTTIELRQASAFAPSVLSAPSGVRPRTATRLRLTVRGRRVIAAVAALPAVIALAFAIVSGGGALASSDGNAPAGTFEQVTVLPGDTLWSLAEEVAPGVDPREVVDDIMRLNALPSGALEVGQTLYLPTEYSAGR